MFSKFTAVLFGLALIFAQASAACNFNAITDASTAYSSCAQAAEGDRAGQCTCVNNFRAVLTAQADCAGDQAYSAAYAGMVATGDQTFAAFQCASSGAASLTSVGGGVIASALISLALAARM